MSKSIAPKAENKARKSFLGTSSQSDWEGYSQWNKLIKLSYKHPDKVSLFIDEVIL